MYYDEPGENPFFVSYQEQTAFNKSHFKDPLLKPGMDSTKFIIRATRPGITLYQIDRIVNELQLRGILEKAGSETFKELVQDVTKELVDKNERVVNAFLQRM
jgi:hypothetical protein